MVPYNIWYILADSFHNILNAEVVVDLLRAFGRAQNDLSVVLFVDMVLFRTRKQSMTALCRTQAIDPSHVNFLCFTIHFSLERQGRDS